MPEILVLAIVVLPLLFIIIYIFLADPHLYSLVKLIKKSSAKEILSAGLFWLIWLVAALLVELFVLWIL